MSTTSSFASLNAPIPFNHDKYAGSIKCTIYKKDQALLISVVGERLSLETFTGPYSSEYRKKFITISNKNPEKFFRPELLQLCSIFQTPENVKNYANGQINTDSQVIKRLDRDSMRPLTGDPFTGFGVVENQTGDIIGRAAVGAGVEPGESQFGLILKKDYHGKKLGKETAILMGALALMFFENQFQVGDEELKLPVLRFTATALNNNISTSMLTKLGCKPIKVIPSGWFQKILHACYLDRMLEILGFPSPTMRKLYEIKGIDLRPALSKYMDINKLQFEFIEL